jgi:hypothetical protein
MSRGRIIFAPRLAEMSDHLARQRQADLFLDTTLQHPYDGEQRTMGVCRFRNVWKPCGSTPTRIAVVRFTQRRVLSAYGNRP